MALQRHFLDWTAPVVHQVVNWFFQDTIAPPVDWSDTLTIVPTRQAGRRLREGLAKQCDAMGTALIPPRVSEPISWLASAPPEKPVAGTLLARAIWADELRRLNTSSFPGLFPVSPPRQDHRWAMQMADLILRARHTITEGGLLLSDVVDQYHTELEEAERWRDLARLEGKVLERLDQAGLMDRAAHLIAQARAPVLSDGIRRIVIAAVPDPTPLMIQAIEHLSAKIPVDLLIHAPSDNADAFDEWGRPRPERWNSRIIDIPDPSKNIRLAAHPTDQARLVLQTIQEEARHIGPSDLAIGVPDPDVIPPVDTLLTSVGLIPFNPAGTPLARHRLFEVLSSVAMLWGPAPSFNLLADFWRHPDVLHALSAEYGVDPATFLASLDKMQNELLPGNLEDVRAAIDRGMVDESLHRAMALTDALRACSKKDTLESALAEAARLLYASQSIDPQVPEQDTFRQVAARLTRLAEETRHPLFLTLNLSAGDTLQSVLQLLSQEAVYEDRPDAQVDLDGWLELHWNDARLLVVTGMNEGRVPDSRITDAFLPDSCLRLLGLRSDHERWARDAYLLTAMIESRRESGGRAVWLTGTYARSGDPLRPSRLLFQCEDEELPGRVTRLLKDAGPSLPLHPATVSFSLDPLAGLPLRIPERVSVTALGAYLACPYRFYLRNVLHLESVSLEKAELDALDFGTLAHYALEGLAQASELRNEADLAALFIERAQHRLDARFGATPPLPVRMQFEALKQRLTAAAAEQARRYAEGWIPTYFEKRMTVPLGPLQLRGTIDRIDAHDDGKRWCILDYKTSDSRARLDAHHWGPVRTDTPAYALFRGGKRPRAWINLQLPLYITLFRDMEPQGSIEAGLFHMPKAVTESAIETWTALSDEAVIASAWRCAEGIAADIAAGRFWPPAERILYDDFEMLFPFPADDSFQEWPVS